MGWVNDAVNELKAGRRVQIRPQGGSMRGRINSGQLVTLEPVDPAIVVPGDIVLVPWKGNYLLHLVTRAMPDELEIGNTLGKINGCVPRPSVIAKVTAVAD